MSKAVLKFRIYEYLFSATFKYKYYYFLNRKQVANKMFNNQKRFRGLTRIGIISLISPGFKGYCCELDTPLYKWRVTQNYKYNFLNITVYTDVKMQI